MLIATVPLGLSPCSPPDARWLKNPRTDAKASHPSRSSHCPFETVTMHVKHNPTSSREAPAAHPTSSALWAGPSRWLESRNATGCFVIKLELQNRPPLSFLLGQAPTMPRVEPSRRHQKQTGATGLLIHFSIWNTIIITTIINII